MSVFSEAAKFADIMSNEDLPEEVIEIAKKALIDYVGVTLAGSKIEVSRIIQKYITRGPSIPEARVFGTNILASHDLAALANGTAGHALDYDDVNDPMAGHPTVAVASAAFAVGEFANASGYEILKAYAVGLEIENRIAQLVMPDVTQNGWHTTSVFGTLGAVSTAAMLMNLEETRFVNAIGIASSMASGIRANFGTMTKPYHAGMAAFNGCKAAILAEYGLTSSKNAFEAQDGFVQTFAGKETITNQPCFGDPWVIVNPGLAFKKYPCCFGTHAAIDCIFEILNKTSFTADDVEKISAGVGLIGPRELVCHNPQDCIEAKFSMEYVLASAIVYGRVGVEQFTDELVNNPTIKEIIPRVKLEVDPEYEEMGFGIEPCKLTILLKDGRILKGRCDEAKGVPGNPLSDIDIKKKFIDCSSVVLPSDRSNRILELLFSLEKIETIDTVMDLVY